MKFAIARVLFGLLLVALVLPGGAGAQDENLLGIFYDTDATNHEVEVSPNSTHALYLVLLNPVNDSYDGGGRRDVEYISAFECAIEHPAGDILLGLTLPNQGMNLGTTDNIIAGYVVDVPVTSQRTAMLGTLSVLTMGNNPEGYRLVPASPSSHPHTMAYLDSEDPVEDIVDMMPASGSFDRPVFTFGDYTVDENANWGQVKALFR